MKNSSPRVSIGLPTYNRPELLALVLDCFRRQTFTDFELIVSDNASPNPKVQELCERYVQKDSRFRYVRQPANQGPERNFWFVFDQARAPLFLWASDDDLWPVDFLEKGAAALDVNRGASAWFCQVVNINADGEVVRSYPSFKRFQSSTLKSIDLVRFLWEPEIMGKANSDLLYLSPAGAVGGDPRISRASIDLGKRHESSLRLSLPIKPYRRRSGCSSKAYYYRNRRFGSKRAPAALSSGRARDLFSKLPHGCGGQRLLVIDGGCFSSQVAI